jgi:hypothetical protein
VGSAPAVGPGAKPLSLHQQREARRLAKLQARMNRAEAPYKNELGK